MTIFESGMLFPDWLGEKAAGTDATLGFGHQFEAGTEKVPPLPIGFRRLRTNGPVDA